MKNKTRTKLRKHKKRISKKNHKKSKKHLKKISVKSFYSAGGPRWKTVKEMEENDQCPICQDKFINQPSKAIYTTRCCNSKIHNSCLHSYCEHNSRNLRCPICRSNKDFWIDCTDADAFENKALGSPNRELSFDEDPKNNQYLLNLYHKPEQ